MMQALKTSPTMKTQSGGETDQDTQRGADRKSFAILEECTQIWLSNRRFELLDILADLIGIMLFSHLALRYEKKGTDPKLF